MHLAQLPAPLLLITDRTQARKPLLEIVEAALWAGCRWVSLREKDLDPEKRLALVREILPRIRDFGATLLVHADLDAALLADGGHLPAGANIDAARARLGEKALIGLSCHTLEDIKHAQGANYVTFGPIGKTASKPGYEPQFGLDVFREAATFGPPVVALGGVDETNVGDVKRAGAAGFAVMGSVMRSDDPGTIVKRLLDEWMSAEEKT